ncbi:hypothetical protein VPH35_056222 [Triticum aestivum]|uniref:F-box/kelch-repeat protein n=1 Tax=Triticum turgidum subsp. durum TaxID=4567 RepID=A0A9R1QXP8_TRITD|nr:unnamed protein product [Triticum turgidum subsp. durum]
MLSDPSFFYRQLPLRFLAVAGWLVLVAGCTHPLHEVLCRPLVFDPGPVPRARALLAGQLAAPSRSAQVVDGGRGCLFVAGAGYNLVVSCSGKIWDPDMSSPRWEPLPPLQDGVDRHAEDAAYSGEKICVVNLHGSGAKEAVVFDPVAVRWEAARHARWVEGPCHSVPGRRRQGARGAPMLTRIWTKRQTVDYEESWVEDLDGNNFYGSVLIAMLYNGIQISISTTYCSLFLI